MIKHCDYDGSDVGRLIVLQSMDQIVRAPLEQSLARAP